MKKSAPVWLSMVALPVPLCWPGRQLETGSPLLLAQRDECKVNSGLWALSGDAVVCILSLSGLGELLRVTEGEFCREKSEAPNKFLPSLPP